TRSKRDWSSDVCSSDLDLEAAKTVIEERSGFDVSPVPGEAQAEVLSNLSPTFVSSGVVDDQQSVDEALDTLFAPEFAEKAESSRSEERRVGKEGRTQRT